MQLSITVRVTVAVCATLIILGTIAGLVVSGQPIDAGALLTGAGVLLSGLLAGVGVAGGPTPRQINATPHHTSSDETPVETHLPRPGSGTGPVVMALLALGATLTACGAIPCRTERGIVAALSVGVDAAEATIPDEAGEDVELALELTRGAVLLGEAATDACVLIRDGAGWQGWVGLALEAVGGLVALFSAGSEDPAGSQIGSDGVVPEDLAAVVELLEAESGR